MGGVLGLIIIGLLNGYTMMLQIYAKIKLNKQVVSYSDLGEKVLGVSGRRIVDLCMVTSQVGFGIAYLLFVGNQIDQVVCFESDFTKCGRKNFYIGIASLFLMPVCWFRSMNYLAYVSIASNICLFLSCKFNPRKTILTISSVFVIIKYALTSEMTRVESSSQLNYFTPSALPFFFGVAVFDFEGNGIVLNIHASMREPEKFSMVLRRVLTTYVFMIGTFSAIVYFVSSLEV